MIEYKYQKVKGLKEKKFLENGHTMFEQDVLQRLKRLAHLEEQIRQGKLLPMHDVSGCYECVVMYRDRQGDGELRQSHHKGETKDEALRDFFDKVGEKGINVLWLNNR